MSLEGTIRDMGLHEVGQLLSLSRKHGVLAVSSVLRGRRAWIRFVDGAMVDAGEGAPPTAGTASAAATAGDRPSVEEAVLDVLSWREGQFAFHAGSRADGAHSAVRIPTDAMLVESVRREDAWSQLRDRIASPDVVPTFVDVEPKALPLLRLVPQEWEVLTRVDGSRDLRALARALDRDLLEVAEVVHRLVGTGLLTVRDTLPSRPVAPGGSPDEPGAGMGAPADAAPDAADSPPLDQVELPPPRVDGHTPPVAADPVPADGGFADPGGDEGMDSDELWIPAREELEVFAEGLPGDDAVFDPQRAGLMTRQGVPQAERPRAEMPQAEMPQAALPHSARTRRETSAMASGIATAPSTATATATPATTVTVPANGGVASRLLKPSADREPGEGTDEAAANARYWREEGNAAVRRGHFDRALTAWARAVRLAPSAPSADAMRETMALTARLQALLASHETD